MESGAHSPQPTARTGISLARARAVIWLFAAAAVAPALTAGLALEPAIGPIAVASLCLAGAAIGLGRAGDVADELARRGGVWTSAFAVVLVIAVGTTAVVVASWTPESAQLTFIASVVSPAFAMVLVLRSPSELKGSRLTGAIGEALIAAGSLLFTVMGIVWMSMAPSDGAGAIMLAIGLGSLILLSSASVLRRTLDITAEEREQITPTQRLTIAIAVVSLVISAAAFAKPITDANAAAHRDAQTYLMYLGSIGSAGQALAFAAESSPAYRFAERVTQLGEASTADEVGSARTRSVAALVFEFCLPDLPSSPFPCMVARDFEFTADGKVTDFTLDGVPIVVALEDSQALTRDWEALAGAGDGGIRQIGALHHQPQRLSSYVDATTAILEVRRPAAGSFLLDSVAYWSPLSEADRSEEVEWWNSPLRSHGSERLLVKLPDFGGGYIDVCYLVDSTRHCTQHALSN